MSAPPLQPGVGFCLQTESIGSPPGRWYLNITKHKLVDLPVAYSGKVADREWILTRGIGNLRVPFDLGTFRKLKERSDGARRTTYCIDVVFNPLIVQLFMDDAFCSTNDQYRPWLVNLALNRVEESIGSKLSAQKVKLVKAMRYKDGDGYNGDEAREFRELPGDLGLEGDPHVSEAASRVPPGTSSEPLIEDVTPASQRKPALKKGFLNASEAKGSLYGDEGSKEGVLPENAGDPMGYLPKGLRQKCKIVDCNSPEYQAQAQKSQQGDSRKAMNTEFSDSMSKSFDAMQRKQDQNKWEADLPDGNDELSCKYDNDYSRFANIPDEEDAPKVEERDWYYDSTGQRRQVDKRQPEATGSQSYEPSGKTGPAVKKGFLDSAQKSIYGPEGSAQGKPGPSEDEMMKNFSKMMGPGGLGDLAPPGGPSEEELMKNLKSLMSGQAPQQNVAESGAQRTPVLRAELVTPSHELAEVANILQVTVSLPGLRSMEGVNLDVTERQASFEFPRDAGFRPLQVQLPADVVPEGVRAKFSKKAQTLTVTMPRAL